MDAHDIKLASRGELETYLQSWGFQVYDHESTDELRDAALENCSTEGDGMGPVEVRAAPAHRA